MEDLTHSSATHYLIPTSPARITFDRQLTATVAPRLASSSAMARPMPRDAPVTNATLPARAFEAGTMTADKVAVAMACSFLFYVISSLTERFSVPCPPPIHMVTRAYFPPFGATHGSLLPSQLRRWPQEDGQERGRCRWGLSFPAVDPVPFDSQHLRRECLVGFDDIHIVVGEACALVELSDSGNRANAHHCRIYTRDGMSIRLAIGLSPRS